MITTTPLINKIYIYENGAHFLIQEKHRVKRPNATKMADNTINPTRYELTELEKVSESLIIPDLDTDFPPALHEGLHGI